MTISRRALFGKLNLTLFRSIESATAFAKLRGNPYVELTHWLHQLWQLTDTDIHRICRHYQIDPQAIERDLVAALAGLPSGATSLSDFSHHIGPAVEQAWVLSSLEFGGQCIRSGWLLAALLQAPELRRLLLGISPAFQKIPVQQLTQVLPAVIAGSPEEREGSYDGSGLVAATPGEASQAVADRGDGKSALAKYCTDLTERARAGEIDPVIGREHEIRTMVDILLRRRQNNPLLTGDAGVGKTAVVEGLALAIAGGDVPPALQEVRLLSLDVGALLRVLDLFLPPQPPAAVSDLADQTGTAELAAEAPAADPAPPFTAAPLPASDARASRDEVRHTLRAARHWFEVHEPSSPVAVLLKQAERMVGKRFSQVADAIPLDLLHKWEAADDESQEGECP